MNHRPWQADFALALLLLGTLVFLIAAVRFFGLLFIEGVETFTGRGRRG